MMKTLEKSLMADGTSSDMLLLKVLTAGKRGFSFICGLLKASDNELVTHLPHSNFITRPSLLPKKRDTGNEFVSC